MILMIVFFLCVKDQNILTISFATLYNVIYK